MNNDTESGKSIGEKERTFDELLKGLKNSTENVGTYRMSKNG